MHLLILSDGKKGHENQSVGLAEALLRRRAGSYEVSSISDSMEEFQKPPSAIIAAGHSTHPFLLRLARNHRCPSVVIMKPSLPTALFNHCLIPEHDMKLRFRSRQNIIATKGALNRIPEEIPQKDDKGLIMLGGPSKHFEWESGPLIKAVESIVRSNPTLTWTVGDSRRTPAETLPAIKALELPITLAPHQEATGSWLIHHLLESQVAWITPDSTSMLFEALTAGCRLGTLPLKPCGTRLSKAHDQLSADGWLTPFANFHPPTELPSAPAALNETARCAELLLERFSL